METHSREASIMKAIRVSDVFRRFADLIEKRQDDLRTVEANAVLQQILYMMKQYCHWFLNEDLMQVKQVELDLKAADPRNSEPIR